jgi:hypothetical protein
MSKIRSASLASFLASSIFLGDVAAAAAGDAFHRLNVAPVMTGGTSANQGGFYFPVKPRTVTSLSDPGLSSPAVGGPNTSVRPGKFRLNPFTFVRPNR